MFPKSLKNSLSSIVMKRDGATGMDTKVVHIDLEPFFCNHIREDVIHERLEDGGSIAKTKEHNSRFE